MNNDEKNQNMDTVTCLTVFRSVHMPVWSSQVDKLKKGRKNNVHIETSEVNSSTI